MECMATIDECRRLALQVAVPDSSDWKLGCFEILNSTNPTLALVNAKLEPRRPRRRSVSPWVQQLIEVSELHRLLSGPSPLRHFFKELRSEPDPPQRPTDRP